MINIDKTSLIIFNMQLDLIPLLHDGCQLTHGCRWVADLFQTHQLPTLLIEHKKLGTLAPSICKVAKDATILGKHHFNITQEPEIMNYLSDIDRQQVVFAGAESHVCLYQSAIALQKMGKEVYILVDTISARSQKDNDVVIQRLHNRKIELITKEMLFFELIEHSELPNYLDLAMKFLDGRYGD